MCRLIRQHPLKSIFFLIVLVSCVHLTNKLLFTSVSRDISNILETSSKNTSFNVVTLVFNPKNNRTESTSYTKYKHRNVTRYTVKNQSSTNVPSTQRQLELCKINMSSLNSSVEINQSVLSFEDLEQKPWAPNLIRGTWSPLNCSTPHKVAIIIPYRNREEHLKILLNHMHAFLQKQLISYGIFIIEQAPDTRFNRAALFNAGYLELQKDPDNKYNCFIFHDVDLLPSNENNFYTCDSSPLHMSVAIDKFNYKLPYNSIFGGAVALSPKHFVQLNGFSNLYFGWGGEDDDMSARLSKKGLTIHRYPTSVARYSMVRHNGDKGNPVNPMRFKLLSNSGSRIDKDGINSLSYEVITTENKTTDLYRHIMVQFPEKEILKQWKL